MVNPFTRKAKLKNHIANTIEIGFSQYGPTLGISGVLIALSHIILVEKISINLMHKTEGTQHIFDWFAFRPHQFTEISYSQFDLRTPSKFTVISTQPYKYNIIFSDYHQYTAMNPTLKKIRTSWEKRVEKSTPVSLEDYKNLFGNFTAGNWFSDFIRELQEMSYWEEGEYFVTTIISTESPKTYLELKKSFSLGLDDVENLKQNSFAIIADLCHQPGLKYNVTTATLF